ncbi:hypothetical protein Taro_002254, partial [Colocasia esculenta]|nr:hypothetical protein [Colocasia esculenta]
MMQMAMTTRLILQTIKSLAVGEHASSDTIGEQSSSDRRNSDGIESIAVSATSGPQKLNLGECTLTQRGRMDSLHQRDLWAKIIYRNWMYIEAPRLHQPNMA